MFITTIIFRKISDRAKPITHVDAFEFSVHNFIFFRWIQYTNCTVKKEEEEEEAKLQPLMLDISCCTWESFHVLLWVNIFALMPMSHKLKWQGHDMGWGFLCFEFDFEIYLFIFICLVRFIAEYKKNVMDWRSSWCIVLASS